MGFQTLTGDDGTSIWFDTITIDASTEEDVVKQVVIPTENTYVDRSIGFYIAVPKVEIDMADYITTSQGEIAFTTKTAAAKTVTITNEGFTPLGVIGYNVVGTGATTANVYACHLSKKSDGSATIEVKHYNTASSVNLTVTVDVLWRKS